MQADFLLGVWTGTVYNSNGWEMKIMLSSLQLFEVGSILGVFDIPLFPCSRSFRLTCVRGQTLE